MYKTKHIVYQKIESNIQGVKKMPKLQQLITFKKDEKYLYDEIQKHSGKGNWVKDILADYLKNKEYQDNIKNVYIGRRD